MLMKWHDGDEFMAELDQSMSLSIPMLLAGKRSHNIR